MRGLTPNRDRSHLWSGLLAALLLLLPAAASAQEAPLPADEAAVQTHLGIYLTVPSRRDSGERVLRNQERLEIWFQRTLPDKRRDRILCEGFRWLLGGRLESSAGVRALFNALPGINEVVLVFYEVETGIEPQANGKYLQVRGAGPRARYAISRNKALQINPAAVGKALAGGNCVAAGERMVDTFWAR